MPGFFDPLAATQVLTEFPPGSGNFQFEDTTTLFGALATINILTPRTSFSNFVTENYTVNGTGEDAGFTEILMAPFLVNPNADWLMLQVTLAVSAVAAANLGDYVETELQIQTNSGIHIVRMPFTSDGNVESQQEDHHLFVNLISPGIAPKIRTKKLWQGMDNTKFSPVFFLLVLAELQSA